MSKYLITAALIYANGPMHLGHIRSTYLPADIFARYLRMKGEDVLYVCATDEHGTPIVVSAEKAGKSPKEFVDYYHDYDERMFKALGMSFDIFHRTSSKENIKLTQHFYTRMKENGYIYEKEVKQLYCEVCKRGLPDRLVKGTCSYCGAEDQYGDYCEKCGHVLSPETLKNPRCSVCGSKPVLKDVPHAFFKLSAFEDKLKDYIDSNPHFQKEVKNFVSEWIKSGLVDWDITRNLSWGVPVPDHPDLVFYVWFDAPIGYISSTQALTDKWEDYWKSKDTKIIHFIGKDIVYHHYLFWPAMLMATGDGYTLPSYMPVRGYLNLEGDKFSKSRGWFVSVEEFLEKFPADYLRYYVTALTPYSLVDADFYWKDFMAKVNNELVANVGNFIYRTLSLIKRSFNSKVPEIDPDPIVLDWVREYSKEIDALMMEFKFKLALNKIMELSSKFNSYLSENEPWKKEGEEKERILKSALVGVHALSVLLYPFIPQSMARLRSMLKLEGSPSLVELEKLPSIVELADVKPLFPKVDPKVIEEMEVRLRNKSTS